METSTVALVRCDDYDEDRVHEALDRALELLGGAGRFVSEGERIVLKPNLLIGKPPEAGVGGHPSVFRAVIRHLQGAGATLTYGDSPGFGRGESVARKAGLADVADELGVACADFASGREVHFPEGRQIKRFHIAESVLDADGLVNLPKLKTHGLTRVTCAVKNTFGCVPGMRKGEFHARMAEEERFAQMLVDLNLVVPARLHVLDAVVGMEGNGPANGDPRPMRALIVGDDPVAVDATACRIIALDPELVHTVTLGQESGLGTWTDVELVGDELAGFVDAEFDVNRKPGSTTGEPGVASRFMKRWMIPKPMIDPQKCTVCGTCVKVCPVEPKAVDWAQGTSAKHGKPPVHDYDICIRCYCCQEMCPDGAIDVETPALGRLVHR
jgi:uncharacterized protein (DUF362 family)/NAD-dependent dihydropyrimidine dehydrogenase PreA subunit